MMLTASDANDVHVTVLEAGSEAEADKTVARLRQAGLADTDIHVLPAPLPTTAVTDGEFATVMKIALGLGIPCAYVVMVLIAVAAGAGLGPAIAIALIPAGFCGMFFLGSASVVSRLDKAEKRAHRQRQELRNARTVTVSGPHAVEAAEAVAGGADRREHAA